MKRAEAAPGGNRGGAGAGAGPARRGVQCALLRGAGACTAAALLWATGGGAPASALVYVMPTDESMVTRSPVIVFGEVAAREPAPWGGPPSTDVLVRVEEVLKGFVPGSMIVVRQPGGVGPAGLATKLVGLPSLNEGDRVLLFLETGRGFYRTVELSLGMFFEVDSGGRRLLLREHSLQLELPARFDVAAQERAQSRLPRNAGRFRRWIADRAAGLEPPADYFVTDPPAGPVSVALEFRHQLTGPECERPGHVFRWPAFDRGESVGFALQRGGQPAVSGDGRAEAAVAMHGWNEDPGSNVSVFVAGGQAEIPALVQLGDGQNGIYFEDPFEGGGGPISTGAIPGSWEQNGVLAVSYVHYVCRGVQLHQIPGRELVRAYEILESDVVTQDGYYLWLLQTDSPRRSHEEVLGHELGHSLGIDHPCGDEESGACGDVTGEALMRATAYGDGRGAMLNDDDRAAVRYLYPAADDIDPVPDPLPLGGYSDCIPSTTPLVLDGGYEVSVCYETADGVVGEGSAGIWGSGEAGLLWFFERGNAEILVKVLDGCAINGKRWVFVAPVTDLAFNIEVRKEDGGTWTHQNPQGATESRIDTLALVCDPLPGAGGVSVSGGGEGAVQGGQSSLERASSVVLGVGSLGSDLGQDARYSDCTPVATSLVLAGGYQVSMCFEKPDGAVGEGRADLWSSGDSGLLWFFSRSNPEMLIKVLDGCSINGHRWVFAVGATDLAFNLQVADLEGHHWTLRNGQGRTAARRSLGAFPCN